LRPVPFRGFGRRIAAASLGAEERLRRLYSTFARGWPAAGLLIMRVVAASALASAALVSLRGESTSASHVALAVLAVAAGALLLAGLWTPATGAVVMLLGFSNAAIRTGDPWAHILLGTLGAALALLGPGAWSVDARLFGWKRIDIQDPKSSRSK
jgi:hypothetical protein